MFDTFCSGAFIYLLTSLPLLGAAFILLFCNVFVGTYFFQVVRKGIAGASDVICSVTECSQCSLIDVNYCKGIAYKINDDNIRKQQVQSYTKSSQSGVLL